MTRAELHELVDEIPEDRIASIGALIVEIAQDEDDEPLTAQDEAALAESAEDVKAGRVYPLQQVLDDLEL